MKNSFVLFSFICFAAYTECYPIQDPLFRLLKPQESQKQYNPLNENRVPSSVYIGPQDGLKEADRISALPGQPHVKFNHYGGHVTVDLHAGRALFYYLAEAAEKTEEKPLVLWLNGGPGCSSFGGGAMTELGPFRVKPDRKNLWYNQYAWNTVANVLFLESPAGVGFSYSNRTSDYKVMGDTQTAADSYTFLVNWLERFPEYKTRDFFITGESYAGHYIPQLADLILENNKNTKHTVIKLKRIAIGNAFIDTKDYNTGYFDHLLTHALISDETHSGVFRYCNLSSYPLDTEPCMKYVKMTDDEMGNINPYNIYAPLCTNSSLLPISSSTYDPCSGRYRTTYLNTKEVQVALHATVAGNTVQWEMCSSIYDTWGDMALTVLPVIKKLMRNGIPVWIYSGDIDAVVPVTATKYSLPKLTKKVETAWYPWYYKGEVGGYSVRYENLTFATVRGAGHMVPTVKPEYSLTLFTSFLKGELLPGN